MNITAVVDDFKSSADGSPLAGKVITIVDDFNSVEGDNALEEAGNAEETKQADPISIETQYLPDPTEPK